MSRKALYAGTFDPFTNGHLDIVKRALSIFDELVILLAVSPTKKPFISLDERKELLNEVFKDEKRISVDSWQGLIVDYAKENNIDAIVRGLRPTGDFEVEFQMASMNRKLHPETETVFLMTGDNLYYISSSLVKEVYNHGGEIKNFVPGPIYNKLISMRK